MCCCLLEWLPCSWLEVVRMTKWHGVHGRRGVGRLSEDLQLYCRLYALIRDVWCCESLHLILKFQGPLLEMGDVKVMIKLFVFWRSFPRVLVVTWGICTTSSQSSSSVPLCLLKSPSISAAACEFQGYLSLWYLGILLLELYLLTQGSSLFYPDVWGIPESHLMLQANTSSSSHSEPLTRAHHWSTLYSPCSHLCYVIVSIHFC